MNDYNVLLNRYGFIISFNELSINSYYKKSQYEFKYYK